jgi:hypothetical protein
MTYFQEIQEKLENGETIMNDANPNFIWTTFTRGGSKQVHIYEGENFEIKEYKSFETLSRKVGSLLNRGY